MRWIHRGPVNSPHKWPVTRKMFLFDDVVMDPNLFLEIISQTHRHNSETGLVFCLIKYGLECRNDQGRQLGWELGNGQLGNGNTTDYIYGQNQLISIKSHWAKCNPKFTNKYPWATRSVLIDSYKAQLPLRWMFNIWGPFLLTWLNFGPSLDI